MTIKPAKPNRLYHREGLSLVELLMAMTLLALISMAGLKIMQLSATITSDEEQNFIQEKMHFSTVYNGWQSGWIRARGDIYGGWLWDSGPEKGQKFWQGGPFDLAIRIPDNLEVQIGMVKPEKVNPLYSRVSGMDAFRRKANVWVNNNEKFHYANFSFGLEGRADCYNQNGHTNCQPWQTPENRCIAAFGGPGQGLWFTAMDNYHSCKGPQIDSICGHYVEWGGQSTDPAVTLTHRSQIGVGKHREYCQLE